MNTHLRKDGRRLIVRRPDENDAGQIISYSKTLFSSTDQVLTTVEEYTITVENEKIWINNLNENPRSIVLIAELDHQVAGLLFLSPIQKSKTPIPGSLA